MNKEFCKPSVVLFIRQAESIKRFDTMVKTACEIFSVTGEAR